jgi:phosphatidylglycerophosphatase A
MDKQIRSRVSLLNPVHFLALGFGSGLAAKMPGTFGTLAALPLVVLLSLYSSFNIYLIVTILSSVVGIWICGKAADDMGVHDDSSIVWDELAGMLITMLAVPLSWQTLLAGFLLFRFFGIMIDDVLAGLFALVCLHLCLVFGWL